MSIHVSMIVKMKGAEECNQLIEFLQSEEDLALTRSFDGCISSEALVDWNDHTVIMDEEWDRQENHSIEMAMRHETGSFDRFLALAREEATLYITEYVDTGGLKKAA